MGRSSAANIAERLISATSKGLIAASVCLATAVFTPAMAEDRIEATGSGAPTNAAAPIIRVNKLSPARPATAKTVTAKTARSEPAAPSKLAIIACRVDPKSKAPKTAALQITEPDLLLPLECMRVIETITDAAAMSNLWRRPMRPNLAQYGTCAEVAMTYGPKWEAAHRNWLIVKIGCPTRIVNANGRTIGWRLPECQGTLPGTTYALHCRFDPSEI